MRICLAASATIVLNHALGMAASEMSGQLSELRALNRELKEELINAERRIATMVLRADYENLKIQANESKALATSLHDCVSLLDSEVEALKKQLLDAESKAKSLEEVTTDLVPKSALQDSQAESRVWQNECKARKNEMEVLQDEKNRLVNRLQDVTFQLERMQNTITEKEFEAQGLRADIVRKNNEMTTFSDVLSQMRAESEQQSKELEKMHKEVEENKKILKQMVKREEAEDHLTEVQRLQQVLREEKSRTAQIKVSFVFEFVSGLCAKCLQYYSLCMFAVLLIEYY
jgi:chromosome segregation ATPase